jgi:hypothetical protein
MSHNEPQHGTKTRYSKGCRCEPCRAAKAVVQAKYRRQAKERKQQEARPGLLEAARVRQPVRAAAAGPEPASVPGGDGGPGARGMTPAEIAEYFRGRGLVVDGASGGSGVAGVGHKGGSMST